MIKLNASSFLKIIILTGLAATLSGCETFTASMYGASANTNYAIKALKINDSVSVGNFTSSGPIDMQCRAVGPIQLPRGTLSITAYVKKAFEDELKLAGAYSAKAPKVILTGALSKVNFSSSKGLMRGYWNIDMTISSNNGKSMSVNEYYEFESGFNGNTACNNTANALMPTVQSLIGKVISSPEFASLVSQ